MTNENVLCGLSLSISKRCLNYNIRFSDTLFTKKDKPSLMIMISRLYICYRYYLSIDKLTSSPICFYYM